VVDLEGPVRPTLPFFAPNLQTNDRKPQGLSSKMGITFYNFEGFSPLFWDAFPIFKNLDPPQNTVFLQYS
jgi:hypothetical protein